MSTINIPLTTLTANENLQTGTVPVAVGVTSYTLMVNRNVGTSSLDSTPSADILLWVDYSLDGGTTWNPGMNPGDRYSTSTILGGPIIVTNKQGVQTQLEQSGETTDIPGDPSSTTRAIRAGLQNGASPVSVSGTLTTQ